MKKLKVPVEIAEAAFQEGDASQKQLLTKFWPDFFMADPYVKACRKLEIEPVPPMSDRSDPDKVSADAYYRLTICIRAKNMIDGKLWDGVLDGKQYHYFPVWKPRSSGFGLAFYSTYYWDTNTIVGARLEYRTEALMMEGVKEFDVYYQDYLN